MKLINISVCCLALLLFALPTIGNAAQEVFVAEITSASPSSFTGGQSATVTVRIRSTSGSGNVIIEADSWPSSWSVSPKNRNPTINQGTYYDQTFTVTPPTDGGSGTIVWKLYDDDWGTHPVGSTLLATRNQSVSATALKPDLIVQDISISPSSPIAGESVTITATLKNQGNARAEGSILLYYYLDGSKIGEDYLSWGLDAGASDNEDMSYTVSSSGNHTIKVVIDPLDAIDESNESNNDRSETYYWNPPPKPDLIVQDISISPSSPVAGESVTITATLKNQGNAGASGSILLYYYLDGSKIGEDSLSWGLDAGESDNEDISYTVGSSGNHTVKVVIDPQDAIDESNESNNDRSETYYWNPPPKPDLIVTDIKMNGQTVLPDVQPGQSVRLDFYGKNVGDATSKTSIGMKWWWGESMNAKTHEIDTGLLGIINGLAPGEEEEETDFSWTIPNEPGKELWITAEIDYDNKQNDEKNENNNLRSESFRVYQPSSLSGVVTNSRTTVAISGALVTISPISNPFELTTPTLSNGSYSFTNIPADTYTLSVSKEGYRVYSGSVNVSGNTTKNVSLTPYVTISTFDVIPNSIELGGRLTVTYYLSNSSGSSQTVWLGASVKRSGTTNWLDDPANDIPVSVPGGASSHQVKRYFDIRPDYSTGDYDIRVSIWQSKQAGLMVERYDSKEQNNGFIVIPAADLAVTAFSMSWPAGNPRGQHPTSGSYTITNNGPSNVVNGSYRIDFYLSTDITINTSDRKIGDNGVALTINSGQTVSGEITSTGLSFVTIPSDMPVDTYYVGMHLVPLEGAPTDPQDNNNWRADGTVTIPISETISLPTSITGPSTVVVNTDNEFTASGASSSLGHSIEYRIDKKGDGSDLTGWRSDGKFNLSWSETRDYNLKAQAGCSIHTDKVSSWSGTLKTIQVIPAQPEWSFVQISDTHIGGMEEVSHCVPADVGGPGDYLYCYYRDVARESLAGAVDQILEDVKARRKIKPDFILVTGDIADYGCNKDSTCHTLYADFLLALQRAIYQDIKVYTVAGNHDRAKAGSSLYHERCDSDRLCYHQARWCGESGCFIEDCADLCRFQHKGFYFIGLDTDSTTDPDASPGNIKGEGLSDAVWTSLKGEFCNKEKTPKIVFGHHPAVDPFGLVQTFKKHRDDFLDWCDSNNVRLVLAGHTHQNKIFDRYGNNLEHHSTARPMFIQTPSTGKIGFLDKYFGDPLGYRWVNVKGTEAYPENVTEIKEDPDRINVSMYSPGSLHLYDSVLRHTGITASGKAELDIPRSFYFRRHVVDTNEGVGIFPEKIIVFDPCDDYLYDVVSKETGSYRLVASSVKDGNAVVFEANDIPSLPDAIHEYKVDWQALSEDQNDQNAVTIMIMIDEDGNGVPEKTITSDGKLTGDEFVSEWPKLDDYVTIQVGEAGYDHQKKRLGVNVTVTNTSGETLGIPLWVVVESVSEPNVTLADANGVSSKDKNYADFSELLLNDRKLDPGESITKRIYFNNPNGVRFTFEPSARGVILSQGEGSKGGMADLAKLSGHWLGDEPALDVAPPGGDGIINLRDFAVMAEKWLEGK